MAAASPDQLFPKALTSFAKHDRTHSKLGDSAAGPERAKQYWRGQSATAKAKVAVARAIARLHGRAKARAIARLHGRSTAKSRIYFTVRSSSQSQIPVMATWRLRPGTSRLFEEFFEEVPRHHIGTGGTDEKKPGATASKTNATDKHHLAKDVYVNPDAGP